MRNLLFVLCIVVAGCGKKSGGGGDERVASCSSVRMHSCRQYSSANLAAGSDNLAKLCTVVDKAAVFAMTACPTANAIGSCAMHEGKDLYYQGYDIEPAADLEKNCTSRGGTWSK